MPHPQKIICVFMTAQTADDISHPQCIKLKKFYLIFNLSTYHIDTVPPISYDNIKDFNQKQEDIFILSAFRQRKGFNMKKYPCPYCGEKALTAIQKFSGKKYMGVAPKATNKLWFTCSYCHNEVSHATNRVSRKYYNILVPCLILLAVLFLVFAAIKQYILLLITIFLATIIAFIMSYISYKYDNFVRVGTFKDELFDVKFDYINNKNFFEEAIYQIKPEKENRSKNIVSACIVAFSKFSPDCKSCKIRFIKPENGKDFVSNCKIFEIYDEFTLIGKGHFEYGDFL